jgi:hypothetical protein
MRKSCLVVAVAVALASGESRLAAQKQQQVFISLTAPDGKPVEGLQASDVGVTEDDVNCKILKVEPINWSVKLQVLVDNGKVNSNPINPLRDGLTALFEQMPDGVEMSLYTTAGTPRAIVKPTTDKQKLISGIGLIAGDGGAGMFFDALSEAADRIAKDKTPGFPVILMIGSDFGRVRVLDQEYTKLQQIIQDKGVTTHIIVTGGSGGTTGGGTQTEIGIAMAKLSGGRYEGLQSVNRLATLLPEWGKRIAESQARQAHQYRITYERPANAKPAPSIGASVKREGVVQLSLRGNLP